MADALPVYSAREVKAAWGGVLLNGFSADQICAFQYNTDLTTETVGADGKLATSVTPDRTGTVSVELMQTSEAGRTMSYILAYQNNLGNTADIIKADFAVSDPSGSVLCVARNAYIKTAPEVALGVEQGTRMWTLYAEKIDFLPVPVGVEPVEEAKNAAIVAAMVAANAL